MRSQPPKNTGRPFATVSKKAGPGRSGRDAATKDGRKGQDAAARDAGDGWASDTDSEAAKSVRRPSPQRSVRTPSLEKDAYFGPGASSTDLGTRTKSAVEQGLQALDLATPRGSAPMLVPPVVLPWMASKFPTVDSLLLRATQLKDGRLVDAKGRSYLQATFERKTQLSTGGMLVTFDSVQPQAYWAKRISAAPGAPLPADLRREIELNLQAKSGAGLHRILRTDDAFYLLMPHMMGDSLELYNVLHEPKAIAARPTSFAAAAVADTRMQDMHDIARLYCLQMFTSVADAHEQKIYHRDIKLENFAYHLGDVRLIDFGSAHLGKKSDGMPLSTPGYLAPDHIFPNTNVSAAKADVYAAGVSVYSLLTGDNFLAPAVGLLLEAEASAHSARTALLAAEAQGAHDPAASSMLTGLTAALAAAQAQVDTQVQALAETKANYALAWPIMREAAQRLLEARPQLAGKGGSALQAAAAKLVDFAQLEADLAKFNPRWAVSASMLLQREPLGAAAILDAVAPTDKQRSTARQAADAYRTAIAKSLEKPSLNLLQRMGQMHAGQIRKMHAQASALAASMKARLASPAPYFDELQLENQPSVHSLADAKAYIKNLQTEAAPKIPILKDVAGGIKRIRELQVLLR